ncbi:MAG: hypothetical protein ACXW18_12280 [Pyrinomonadaceae bacterium]
MREVFADTSYFVALFNPNDEWHSRALEVEKQNTGDRVVTTEFVIVEVLNYFSRSQPSTRVAIVAVVRRILSIRRLRQSSAVMMRFSAGWSFMKLDRTRVTALQTAFP